MFTPKSYVTALAGEVAGAEEARALAQEAAAEVALAVELVALATAELAVVALRASRPASRVAFLPANIIPSRQFRTFPDLLLGRGSAG